MSAGPLHILVIEDNPGDARLIDLQLQDGGAPYTLVHCTDLSEAAARLDQESFDAMLLDLGLPDGIGIEAVRQLNERAPQVPIIVLTGLEDDESAVGALKMGAQDYLVKSDLSAALLAKSMRYAIERSRLEHQARQSQRMESIGQLAGGVAHDFNNLLTVMQGRCELAVRSLNPSDPLADSIGEILSCCERASALTRQLLAFSRRQPLRPRVLDANQLIGGMESMLRRLIGEDIDLRVQLGQGIGRIKADPGQVEQVVMNLVVNARDAMPRGGTLTIESRDCVLDASSPVEGLERGSGPHVLISVRDSGVGMDAATRRRIFEPFFTTKDRAKGTGLGLSTVYGIVRQSGGHVRVDSEIGRGTSMDIYFPRTAEEGVYAPSPAPRIVAPGTGEHILVVEDEPAVRQLLQSVVKELGYQVTTAANGGEALLAVDAEGIRPDLVITDVIMPGMTGKLLVEQLRARIPDLRVLYTSGYIDGPVPHPELLEADTPFLQKPFNLRELGVVIRQLFESPQPA